MFTGESFSHMHHNLMDIAHNFAHGPTKHIKVQKLVFLRLMFFNLLDIHLIFLIIFKSTSIRRMAPLLKYVPQ